MALTTEQLENLKINDWVKYNDDPRQVEEISEGELGNKIARLRHSKEWVGNPEDEFTLLP